MVGAAGMSLEEAASICRCEIGTIKSRVHRGRARLAELMAADPPDFADAMAETQAVGIRTPGRQAASHREIEAMPN
jgi:RNA polymerase sigma-70 factor (ECF subfamily)